jgi:hypothetical protein
VKGKDVEEHVVLDLSFLPVLLLLLPAIVVVLVMLLVSAVARGGTYPSHMNLCRGRGFPQVPLIISVAVTPPKE